MKISDWRLINAPATVGEKFNGAVLVPIVPIFFLSMITKVFWMNFIPIVFVLIEVFRIQKKLCNMKDVFKYIFFHYFVGLGWHGYRRYVYSSLTSVFAALIFLTPIQAKADFKIIWPEESIPKPNIVTPNGSFDNNMQKKNPGGEFVDNVKIIKGAGPAVELELLLQQIMPKVYSVEYKSVEIASMKVNWRSTSWTLDQVMGNIAMRYGVMFETMHGSSVVSVDWYDPVKCSKEEKKIFKRICGTSDGFYID